MTSMLSGLTTNNEIQNETDSVGGGGVLESGLYKSTITLPYLLKSASGALGLHVHFKNDDGREFRQTLYVTSGDAKGNKNYYENKQGDKKYLPGFIHADALCLLTIGKGIAELAETTEMKVVNVYSPEAKAEVPTQVEVLTDLIGQEVLVGLQKQIADKNVKNDQGQYVPSGETREENEIDKIFRAKDGMTTAEIRAEAAEATFVGTWKEKWEGKTRDKSTKQSGQNGAPQRPAAAGGAQTGAPAPRSSLFGGS